MIFKRHKSIARRLKAGCAFRAGLLHRRIRFFSRKAGEKRTRRLKHAGLHRHMFRLASGLYPVWIYPIEPRHIMIGRIDAIIETTRKAWKIERMPSS
ncbi:MAG: hypothetical protein JHC61_02120 [Burkholderiaceae bacterium]|nr:hypothetical protein [Burkholderiaceae bacterium]